MITGVNHPEQVVEAVKAGVTSYLVKPVQPETLQLKLKQAWEKTHPRKS
jgi:DNA-binding NtrC family response regulator